MASKKQDANAPFIPQGVFGVSAFDGGTDGKTLRLILTDPKKTVVWIDSKLAWEAYKTPSRKKPACTFEPPTFSIYFEDGSSKHWLAKLGHNPENGDLMLFDLIPHEITPH